MGKGEREGEGRNREREIKGERDLYLNRVKRDRERQ
jgi:hypothetical protein